MRAAAPTLRRRLARLAAATSLLAAGAAAPQRGPVLLEIRPHPGDTLRMRLDQQTALSGTARRAAADTTRAVATAMRLFARAIVQREAPTGTIVLAVADSLTLETNDEHGDALRRQMERALLGRAVRMRVSPDGSAEPFDEAGGTSSELRALVSLMPGTLPRSPVAVGESWTRTMPMPAGTAAGTGGGILRAAFRLDSLTRGGQLAWISLRGTVSRDSAPVAAAPGGSLATTGTVTGMMQIDRRLGWMTDARASVVVHSTLTPARGSRRAPMRFVVRITQRLVLLQDGDARD